MPIPTDHHVSPDETAMSSGAIRSGYLSISRLSRRYRSINFEECARDLCLFLRSQSSDGRYAADSLFNKFRTAERALYPEFGAIGLNRDNNLRTALYYWMAANDTSPDIVASVEDRRACFVRALHEAQRGNNAKDSEDHTANSGRINFEDNENPTDNTICRWGVTNKFAECFMAMHPDVMLIESLKDAIYDLVRGFIAEYLVSKGQTHAQITSATLALEDEALLPAAIKTSIKQKVIEIYGTATDSFEGVLTATEITYLDQIFSEYLELISFTVYDSDEKLQKLIHDARTQLRDARIENISRRARITTMYSDPTTGNDAFDQDLIFGIISSLLPQPTNSAYIFGNLRRETIRFDPDTHQVTTVHGPSITDLFMAWIERAQQIYSASYSEQVLVQAMQPQAVSITPTQVQETRHQRRIAMGARPNSMV